MRNKAKEVAIVKDIVIFPEIKESSYRNFVHIIT